MITLRSDSGGRSKPQPEVHDAMIGQYGAPRDIDSLTRMRMRDLDAGPFRER